MNEEEDKKRNKARNSSVLNKIKRQRTVVAKFPHAKFIESLNIDVVSFSLLLHSFKAGEYYLGIYVGDTNEIL